MVARTRPGVRCTYTVSLVNNMSIVEGDENNGFYKYFRNKNT